MRAQRALVLVSSRMRSFLRSFLYVPADQPAKLAKALSAGADAIICDLEDAVAPQHKDLARTELCSFLAADLATGQEATAIPSLWVRINDGGLGLDDIAAIVRSAGSRLAGVVVPKAQRIDAMADIDRSLSVAEMGAGLADRSVSICALLETASGILDARQIASAPRVVCLALGEADLGAELGTELTAGDEREHLLARQLVVLASAAAGLRAPVGPVSTDFRDLEGFRSATIALKRLGFRSRPAIHPAQIASINDVFTPTSTEVDAARRIVELFDASVERGDGVCIDDAGRMVDEAVVRQARYLLGAE